MRKPMVTRTIESTKARVLCVNIKDNSTSTIEVILPRTYKTPDKALKVAKEKLNTDVLNAVHIMDMTVEKQLYGMTEEDFVRYAAPIKAEPEAEQ